MPTKLVDATYLETASDDWFVDGNGDLIPDIAIGRLPVRTADEAALVVLSSRVCTDTAGDKRPSSLLMSRAKKTSLTLLQPVRR